jgi:hypothetical protein
MRGNNSAIISGALALLILTGTATPAASRGRRGDRSGGCAAIDWSGQNTHITVHLMDRVRLARHAREEMIRETSTLWRAAGVHVHWSNDALNLERVVTEPDGAHIRVVIAAEPSPTSTASNPSLSTIMFVDGKPTTSITAYALDVRRLLESIRVDDIPFGDRPRILRDRLTGRVLGRALAHELGHFLFATAEHASSGLMRPAHRLDHLVDPSHRPFRIVPPPSGRCDAAQLPRE